MWIGPKLLYFAIQLKSMANKLMFDIENLVILTLYDFFLDLCELKKEWHPKKTHNQFVLIKL